MYFTGHYVLPTVITASYPDTSIAHWKLDSNFVDSIGGYNGTITGSDYLWSAGQFDTCFNLTGSTTWGNAIISSSVFVMGSSSSVSLWCNPLNNTSGSAILSWAGTTGSASPWVLIQRKDSTNIQAYVDGAFRWTFAATDNNWYHVVVTYDGVGVFNCYVNNVSQSAYSGLTDMNRAAATNLYFGSGYSNYFKGKIDNVAIYNRNLNVSEINSLYTNGSV